MERIDLLRSLSFGARVAEEETAELAKYFVETRNAGLGEYALSRHFVPLSVSVYQAYVLSREFESSPRVL